MRFKIIKAYYGSVTMYRVVKIVGDYNNIILTDVHTYNDYEVALTVTKALNLSVGV